MLNKQEVEKNAVDVKNGLLTLLIGLVLFVLIFIFCKVINLNPGISLSIYFCAATIFALSVPGRKNLTEKKEKIPLPDNENTSDLLIWLAAPFDDKSARGENGMQKHMFRKFLIIFLMLMPFLCVELVLFKNYVFNQIHDQAYHGVDVNPYHKDAYSENNALVSKMKNEYDSMKLCYVQSYLIDVNKLFSEAKYKEALDSCKSIDFFRNDTAVYLMIGNCFLHLKQKDSACYYWSLAKQNDCVKADSLMVVNCNSKK